MKIENSNNEQFDSKQIHLTPRGVAIYPHLVDAKTKFKQAGEYSVRMRFKSEDEAVVVEKLTAFNDLAYRINCKKEFKTQLKKAPLPWKEDQDGNLLFNFKTIASWVDENGKVKQRRPQIFDAKGNEIDEPFSLRIGSGSEMVVIYRVHPYFTAAVGSGISLRLEGVRIFKYVDYKRDAAYYGFQPEDGFDYKATLKKPAPGSPQVKREEEPDPEYIPDASSEDDDAAE